MEPRRLTGPKLDFTKPYLEWMMGKLVVWNLLGDKPPASPMIGERNIRLDIPLLYAKPFSDLVYLLIKLTLCNRRTLITCPSTDSTTERPTAKVSFALFSRDFLDPSDGSHLPMDFAHVGSHPSREICENCNWCRRQSHDCRLV
jgi:hypothetical protein